MNRLFYLPIIAATAAAMTRDARACEPLGYITHTVDPSMQATDQMPPTLPAIPPAQFHFANDDSRGGCGGSYCPDVGSIQITVAATDDWTKPGQIGYRLSLVAGALAPGLMLPADAIEPGGSLLQLYWDSTTGRPVDFTLQVVAIDLAGNESAPQTVRVKNDSGHACAVAQTDAHPGAAGITLLALIATAYGRRRR
jgi:MYXO-CTERM domain-containing protein